MKVHGVRINQTMYR